MSKKIWGALLSLCLVLLGTNLFAYADENQAHEYLDGHVDSMLQAAGSLQQDGIYITRRGSKYVVWVPNYRIFSKNSSSKMNYQGMRLLDKISSVIRNYKKSELEVIAVYSKEHDTANNMISVRDVVMHQTRLIGRYVWGKKKDVSFMSIQGGQTHQNEKLPFWSKHLVSSPFTLIKFRVI